MHREHDHIDVWRPGRVAYAAALAWQHTHERLLLEDRGPEALALLEHHPVYTLGARGERRHLLAAEGALRARGAAVVETDRGGDITFHGPGQLVAYPILHLRNRGLGAADYVRTLEQAVIDTLAALTVEATRVRGRPGVWVPATGGAPAKIAAVGVRVRRGVSTHGLALNVSTDLAWFDAIVPCGLADAGVTSLQHLLGEAPPMHHVEDLLAAALARLLDADLQPIDAPSPEMEPAGV